MTIKEYPSEVVLVLCGDQTVPKLSDSVDSAAILLFFLYRPGGRVLSFAQRKGLEVDEGVSHTVQRTHHIFRPSISKVGKIDLLIFLKNHLKLCHEIAIIRTIFVFPPWPLHSFPGR